MTTQFVESIINNKMNIKEVENNQLMVAIKE